MLRFLCGGAFGQPALLFVLQGSSSRGLITKSGPLYLKQLSPSSHWISTSVQACSAAPPKDPTGHAQQSPDSLGSPGDLTEPDPLQDNSIGLVQRFKKTLKQYGKVMIPVHLVTSSVWFGAFYYSAMKGVNLVPFLEYFGFPDRLVKLIEKSQSGYALTAYAMYKIATPARYTFTLGGTSLCIRYLRKHGYMSTPPPVKEYIQEKMEETKERISEKMEETKERISEKMEETKERVSEKMEETKERISEKMEETKDRFSGRMEETKDKFTEKIQETKDKVGLGKKTE